MIPTRMGIRRAGAALVLVLASGAASSAGQAERGQLLYENHCLGCHWRMVHYRPRHVARNLADLGWQIQRWQWVLGLGWDGRDLADVLAYLNGRYYGFPVPGPRPGP